MSTFEKEKEISRLRSGVCSHSFIDMKGSAARNWVGSAPIVWAFLGGFICTDVQILQHLFGYILICFFFSLFTKKAHVDKEINNRSVKSVGMETNNLC